MKHVLLAAVLALSPFAALAQDAGAPSVSDNALPPAFSAFQIAARFNCANVGCKQLSSCEEACYKLIQCGQRIRDRDNDGIPCENLCSRPCPR